MINLKDEINEICREMVVINVRHFPVQTIGQLTPLSKYHVKRRTFEICYTSVLELCHEFAVSQYTE